MNESSVYVLMGGRELLERNRKERRKLWKKDSIWKKYKVRESKLFALPAFRINSGEMCRLQWNYARFAMHQVRRPWSPVW